MVATKKLFVIGFSSLLAAYLSFSPIHGRDREKASGFGPARPLSEILNLDGTLKLGNGIQGSFDPKGFRLVSGAGEPPRFVPAEARTAGGVQAAPGDQNWDDRFHARGTSGEVRALVVNGEDLFVGGNFTEAGTVAANNIAKWDGSFWSALGSGLNGEVNVLAVIGTDLFVGGLFTQTGDGSQTLKGIAKWNGGSWSALNSGLSGGPYGIGVYALAVIGTNLYVGGYFSQTADGSQALNCVAKWDGNSWSPLGPGLWFGVNALAVMGTDLYAGGGFYGTGDGSQALKGIAKWDGISWSPLGPGLNKGVTALAVSGTDLYVGGWFTQTGDGSQTLNYIAKWSGSFWSALDSGLNGGAYALTVSGTDLYVGGYFTITDDGSQTLNYIAKWDGISWSALGPGLNGGKYGHVSALAVSGTDLYVGGGFTQTGDGSQVISNIAKWDGIFWLPLIDGSGASSTIIALAVSDSTLYAGGYFATAGGANASCIAKWDGSTWSALGAGLYGGEYGHASALAVVGTDLYVGGQFTQTGDGSLTLKCIAKWDGSSWSALGSGLNGEVDALAVIGTDLYVGGAFTQTGDGSQILYRVAKWDGTAWSALGSGLNSVVSALAASGKDLYVGGEFTQTFDGSQTLNGIAKWNGASWSALGSGLNHGVDALAVSGADLYVGGWFTQTGDGSLTLNAIAKWNGTSWSALGSGTWGGVRALVVSGTDLYVGGGFPQTFDRSQILNYIARWNGTAWSTLGSGTNGPVNALALIGEGLYAGGDFTIAGTKPSSYIALWHLDLFVNTPNGGEIWDVSSTQSITWFAVGSVASVKIEYSADNGLNWTDIISSTPNTGSYSWTVPNTPSTNCLVRVSDAANPSSNDTSDAAFTIFPLTGAILSLSRTSLNYGSAQGTTATQSQEVIISNSGEGTLNWTATANRSWITVLPTSGTGIAQMQVGVSPSGLAVGTCTGAILVTAHGATYSPQAINVTLRVYDSGATIAPFGYFDTPADGTTGIEGSLPVTGWALDDIEVTKVDIWRDPVGGEPVHSNGYVYIGDAIFVGGARPDVETAFPNYPLNYRAGWGYMMLTNFLPNSGNGTFRIHAIAYDKEGHSTEIGTKTITCDNAHATLPFGAIDTPAQGGTWDGTQVNFGWALTPMPKSIPTDGSTILLWIDGEPVGHPTYNNYRSDIATLFPGFANSNGAVGYYYVDTTPYANGVHTIAWSVEDSGGAASGIGSRYFAVLNTGSAAGLGEASILPIVGELGLDQVASPTAMGSIPTDYLSPVYVKRGYDTKALSEPIFPDANGVITIEAREVERIEIALSEYAAGDNPIGRTLDEKKAASVNADNYETGRVRNRENPARIGDQSYVGYLLVGDELRRLPIGSTFDAERGVFCWQLGPGFVGEYNFVFISQAGTSGNIKKNVRVRILPAFQL